MWRRYSLCKQRGLMGGKQQRVVSQEAGGRTFDCEKNMDIKSVIEDREGQIWIGTWEQGLLRYNPQEELYYTYEGINPGNSAHVIFQDEAGIFGSVPGGMDW